MAIDSSANTIDSPQGEQEAGSLLQRARNGARRLQSSPIAEADAVLAKASVAANTAYTSLWDRGQDFLEQLAFSFFLAPVISFIYLIRLFIGTMQNGGFTISYRSFMLKAIPGLKIYDIRRHTAAIAFIFLFLIQVTIVVVFIRAANDKVLMAKLQLCAVFNATCT
jgi:hypothetical protein